MSSDISAFLITALRSVMIFALRIRISINNKDDQWNIQFILTYVMTNASEAQMNSSSIYIRNSERERKEI
jgi:hypothetical protein